MTAGLPHDDNLIQRIRAGFAKGLSYSEIGDRLGMSRNAVAGVAYRHARGAGLKLNYRKPPNSRPKMSNDPEIRSAIVQAVSDGIHDAEIARRIGRDPNVIRDVRRALADTGVVLPRNPVPSTVRVTRGHPTPPINPCRPTIPKPSAFALRGLVLVSSQPRPLYPGSASTWSDADIIRLRELARTQPSSEACAKTLGRPTSSVQKQMAISGIHPTYQVAPQHKSAIERLHGEGLSVRRICIRTGVPIPLVEPHLERIGRVVKYGGSSPQDVGETQDGLIRDAQDKGVCGREG